MTRGLSCNRWRRPRPLWAIRMWLCGFLSPRCW